ncbi:hypothetical protein FGB62_39g110 [Gracilaria domingensis]|nr:hypothetical protein FGB62_39g110 [Gracilaria domingensis]
MEERARLATNTSNRAQEIQGSEDNVSNEHLFQSGEVENESGARGNVQIRENEDEILPGRAPDDIRRDASAATSTHSAMVLQTPHQRTSRTQQLNRSEVLPRPQMARGARRARRRSGLTGGTTRPRGSICKRVPGQR